MSDHHYITVHVEHEPGSNKAEVYYPQEYIDEKLDALRSENLQLRDSIKSMEYWFIKRNHFQQYTCNLCDAYADTKEAIVHDPDCEYPKIYRGF